MATRKLPLLLRQCQYATSGIHKALPTWTRQLATTTANATVTAKKFVYYKAFEGEPTPDNFKLEEEILPELKDGEVHFEALCLSVDPYMRAYVMQYSPGITMIGSQVAKVIESRNPKYKTGSIWVVYCGWRTHTVMNPDDSQPGLASPAMPVPPLGDLPASLALGAVGMPGNAAYFGLLELCEPKEGETVVVSGAAGAVGSLVGQIAKIKGCTAIGFAGSDDKVKWLVEELGFDFAFNYKTSDLNKCLKDAAPKGVDCYFDNVGGMTSHIVMKHMNTFGRISVCGAISSYNEENVATLVPSCEGLVVLKQLRMEGFVVTRWGERWLEGLTQMTKWIQEGKIKYRETTVEGFKNMPNAFIGMMKGQNTGKMIVQV